MATDKERAAEIQKSLKLARKQDLNFGFCLGKKPENSVLITHRTKGAAMLGKQAKREGETAKMVFGTMACKSTVLSLNCFEDPPSGIARKMKAFLSSAGIAMKIKLLDAEGNLIEDDGSAEDVSDVDDTPPETDDETPDDPLAAKWEAVEAKLGPAVAQAVDGGVTGADKLGAAWTMALDRAGSGDYAAALKVAAKLAPALKAGTAKPADAAPAGISPQAARLLKTLMPAAKSILAQAPDQRDTVTELLQTIRQGDDAAATGAAKELAALIKSGGATQDPPPEPPQEQPEPTSGGQDIGGISVMKLGKARLEWIDLRRGSAAQVAALQKTIRSYYADTPGTGDMVASAFGKVDSAINRLNATLEDQLDDLLNAGTDEDRRKHAATVSKTVGAFKSLCDSDPILSAIDGNEFDASTQVIGPIKAKLDEIGRALGI
ncbi:hypothetical protein [Pukyongiella litopenaei]|uniref:Uncharacterized protein n=1 Tax=Pukyongiella litopenaei TaxID=2605946 RepID=A0A2S0MLB3_9RHOB|nr:hypothetical protein [Pukyongiella litopenaei]AVO36669.1 hypothetical protein C6Y53_02470 [Pukyongiella litopenaei]